MFSMRTGIDPALPEKELVVPVNILLAVKLA
jgi:hypothetical protein